MYLYFNPNYKLIPDGNKVYLLSKGSFIQRFEQIKSDINFFSTIHPIYAIALSFFNGDEYAKISLGIKEVFGQSLGSTILEKFDKLIDNENRINVEFNTDNILFPKHTIIKAKAKIENYKKHNYLDFVDLSPINLKPERSKAPIDLTLMINTICQTNCSYCYADKRIKMNCQIPLGRLKEIIKEANILNMRSFDIIGGEVFLYPHWRELTKELIDNDFKPFYSTKYILSEQDIVELKDLGITDIQISLDSLDENYFISQLKSNKEYLSRISETIKLLDIYGINIHIHSIVTKHNAKTVNFENLLCFLQKFKHIKTFRVEYLINSLYLNSTFEEIVSKRDDRIKLSDFFKNINKENYNFEIIYADIYEAFEKKGSVRKTRDEFFFTNPIICSANYISFFILPDGKVSFCEQLYWDPRFILGDILNSSLLEIWQSNNAIEMYNRRLEHPKGACEKCTDKVICHDYSSVCYKDVLLAYGKEKLNFPDPRCFNAPDHINSFSFF